MNGVLIGILVYVVAQLIVGLMVSRRVHTEADYLVAGRRLGLGLASFSLFATWFGAESCIGAAAKFYHEGIAGGVTDPFGYTLALLLVGRIFAAPLWERGLTTLADLFRQRFGTHAERTAALLMAPTSVFWAAAQIRAFGQVLGVAGDLPIVTGMLIATGVVIIYSVAGGLFADVITDLVQGIAIIVGLIVLLGVMCFNGALGNVPWGEVTSNRLNLFGGEDSWWAKADLWMMTLLGSLVAQEVLARVLATRNAIVARQSATLGGWMYLAVGLIPAFLGMIGPALLPGLEDGEALLPELAQQHLPGLLFILFAGALVSAILSTVDSTLLAASALVSHNVIVAFRPTLGDAARLKLARTGVAVMGIIACGLALGSDSIFELVQMANGIGSGGIFVLMCFGLFSRRGGKVAALACIVTGTVTWAVPTVWMPEFPAPYLLSLVAALAAFVIGAQLETPTPPARAETSGAATP